MTWLHGALAIVTIGLIIVTHIAIENVRAKNEWKKVATERNSVAHNFLNACRLIDIQQDGRYLFFTFSKGEEIFVIETMKLMSDNVKDWRKKAGLDR